MASKPKPTARERVAERICPNCGKPVQRVHKKGPIPTFCTARPGQNSIPCKVEMNNRLTVEGRTVIALLKAWRIDRGQGEIAQAAFQQVCEIVDLFNAQDLAAGRPRADYHAASIIAQQTRYFDRRRIKIKQGE